ncbi:MAG TPA: hypothetical protein VK661_00245 [Planctomycetota bacterium]|jgi:hypothetical protein|nr:hypothetical protein [Planctomycetota bacterium]
MKLIALLLFVAILANTVVMGKDHGYMAAVSLFSSACLGFVAGTFFEKARPNKGTP